MSLPLLRTGALTVGTALLLAGCGSSSDEGATNGPEVAAAFYPLAYVAEQVAGEHASVTNLTTPGGEPHDLELAIKDTAELAGADLVLYLEDFQPAVDAAVEENAGGATLEVGDVVGLQPFAEHSDEGHSDEAHSDEHEDEAHEEEDGHDHGDDDPHFWLDPLRMADLADAVAEELSDLDAEHADDYAANAAALRTDLEDLDAAYESGLASCERDLVVVNHDAFGYLARYGLHLEPIVGLSPDAEPTAADLDRLQRLIREEGITTVFSESLVSPKTAETLASDVGVDADVLDPVEGLSDQTSEEDYVSLMRANLTALQEANGC
ncbi:metal ABC transporter substrate-binding protein [Nocardioides pacificus]